MSHPVCYNRLMIIETDMKEKDTYELWYLGDNFDSRIKCRESLNELVKQANELIVEGRFEGLTVGGIEIAHRSGDELETLWDFNFADGKEVNRSPRANPLGRGTVK